MFILKLSTYTLILFLASIQVAVAGTLEKQVIVNAEAQGAVCMDGSPAVYYIAQQEQQKNWLIMLGGGSPCGTLENCEQTLKSKVNMTSSKARRNFIKGRGLLSSDQSQNPTFANWNKVFIPQCSMDVWIGNQAASEKTHGLAFQGGSIAHAAITALKGAGLADANKVLLVGNSAGGIGVMNHIDWIVTQLPQTMVKGIADGGWILDAQPFPSRSTIHQNIQTRLATLAVQVDADCAKAYPDDSWQCIIGEYVYPHIQSPLFVRISQTDPVHLRRLGISQHPSEQQDTYIQKHAASICQSLAPVSHFFSVKGTPHTVVKNNRIFSLSYQGKLFYDAVSDYVLNTSKTMQITDCNTH